MAVESDKSEDALMLRHLRSLCLGLVLICAVTAGQPAAACPMCKIAHEDATDPAVVARPRAYMYSILFMLSMPATLATAFGLAFYRLSRKQQALNAALMAEYGDDSISS